jgi:hypothetical protein
VQHQFIKLNQFAHDHEEFFDYGRFFFHDEGFFSVMGTGRLVGDFPRARP